MRRVVAICVLAAAGAVPGCAGDDALLEIRDVKDLPQDCLTYIESKTQSRPLLPDGRQDELLKQFRRAFFEPWNKPGPSCDTAQVRDRFDELTKRQDLYGPNLRKLPVNWIDKALAAADLGTFPNSKRCAIAVRSASVRELPTDEPCFESSDKPGGGYPFDLLQATALAVGTPLYVSHLGQGTWAFVESPLGCGWMHLEDLAFVPEEVRGAYQAAELAAVAADNCVIHEADGRPLLTAHIGTVLPVKARNDKETRLSIPQADAQRNARIETGVLPAANVSVMPLPLTAGAIAQIANRMLGQPYGWGGLYGNRDCSSTTHDLLAPFGIWLPRNSSEQARAGTVIPLKGLAGDLKERLILEQGVPWLTLLSSPGHVMLYIGQRDGRAIILHNFWGVTTRRDGREGRHVVARCIITTLQPGIELPDIALPEGDRRNVIESMVLLEPPAEGVK